MTDIDREETFEVTEELSGKRADVVLAMILGALLVLGQVCPTLGGQAAFKRVSSKLYKEWFGYANFCSNFPLLQALDFTVPGP